MAQSKLNEFANRFGKSSNGINVGIKVLAMAGIATYGVSQSMYTGIWFFV
jgi:hypothetical protein